MRIDHRTELIENQIARFAPDFRDCVLARSVSAALEQWNPNLVGGDFLGGTMDFQQLLLGPTPSLYRTRQSNRYLCGASTPLVGVFTEWPGIMPLGRRLRIGNVSLYAGLWRV
jgi:phytoene dehydrogenase-like protein